MILVTGATGTVARPLVDLLAADGAEVRAVTRDPDAAALPAGVDVVAGDPSRPYTTSASLTGVTALFLHPRAVGLAAGELLALAVERGVRRVVALSAMNVDDELDKQPSRFRGDRNREVEEAAVASGLEWVSLRAGFFAVNTLHAWGGQIHAGDIVRGPYAAATEAPIDPRDIAAVAAYALLEDELVGHKPVLTGPQSLTQTEMVTAIGDAIGRPLLYQEVSPQVAKLSMVQLGFPWQFVDAYLDRLSQTVGQPALVSGEVEKIVGRPARTFAEWAADHAADFQN
jgi:uncharacterized protein YbjT (DUF2867 family)